MITAKGFGDSGTLLMVKGFSASDMVKKYKVVLELTSQVTKTLNLISLITENTSVSGVPSYVRQV